MHILQEKNAFNKEKYFKDELNVKLQLKNIQI